MIPETGPINQNPQNQTNQSQKNKSSWNEHEVKSIMKTTGYGISATGLPIMTLGFFHGFARNISTEYLKKFSKCPSGAFVFLLGLGMHLFGNSIQNSFSNSSERSPYLFKIEVNNKK